MADGIADAADPASSQDEYQAAYATLIDALEGLKASLKDGLAAYKELVYLLLDIAQINGGMYKFKPWANPDAVAAQPQ